LRFGRVDVFRPKGHWFDSRSSGVSRVGVTQGDKKVFGDLFKLKNFAIFSLNHKS